MDDTHYNGTCHVNSIETLAMKDFDHLRSVDKSKTSPFLIDKRNVHSIDIDNFEQKQWLTNTAS